MDADAGHIAHLPTLRRVVEDPMSTDRLTDEQIAALRALAEQATPGPWAYEATAEKSNDWAVGQAFDEHGHPLSGRLDTSVEWLEDRIITRRLIGESEDAPRLADAAYIAAANPAVLLALLIEMQEWRTALDELHVSNWIGVVDGLTPGEAVRKLLEYALDQERAALRDELARALAEVQELRIEVQTLRVVVQYLRQRGVGDINERPTERQGTEKPGPQV